MRVLIVSGLQIYPPESGGMLRTSGMVVALQNRGFDVTVYSMVGRKQDYLARKPSAMQQTSAGFAEYVERGRLWAGLQFLSYRFNLPPLWITATLSFCRPRKLRELLADCDAVIIDFPFLYPAARMTAKPVALNTHNVEAELWPRGWLKRLVAAIERRAARTVLHVFCCSDGDRAHFASIVGAERTSIVPNGIDTARFSGLAPQRESMRASLGYADADRVLLFTASAFGPNVEALAWLEEFVSRHDVLLARKNLHFLVVGSVSKEAFSRGRLRAVGKVPEVEPYFAAADLAFNGILRGSGTNVKVAEFIAAGLPILTSTNGMRGYDLLDGRDCIAFTPETLATVLAENTLLDDPAGLAGIAKSAYHNNRHTVDMTYCIEPMITWLRSHPTH